LLFRAKLLQKFFKEIEKVDYHFCYLARRRKNKKKQGGKKARALLIKAPLVDRGAGTYDTKHSTEALIH